jgi:alcohol dehydrogenase
MRAWMLDEIGADLRLAEVPEPTLRGGGVLVRILASHVPAYTGALLTGVRGGIPTPLVLGPGCVGRVEAVAEDVFNVRPGDVVVGSLFRSGDVVEPQEVLLGWTGVGGRGIATEVTDGMQARWRDGTFAERAVWPKETQIRLPGAERYPRPERLAFLGWLSIAAEGLNRAELRAGQTVVVLGATGQLGAAAVLVALAQGAARVVAVGRNAEVLERLGGLDRRVRPVALTGDRGKDATAIGRACAEVAPESGAKPEWGDEADGRIGGFGGGAAEGAAGDQSAWTAENVGAVGELGVAAGADVVIDVLGAVPSAEPTLAGFDSLRPGGTMVLVGGVRQELPLPYGDIMRRRLTVRGSWMFPAEAMLAVWRMVAAGTIDLDALDVRTVGLDDPAAALELAAATTGPAYVALVPDSSGEAMPRNGSS